VTIGNRQSVKCVFGFVLNADKNAVLKSFFKLRGDKFRTVGAAWQKSRQLGAYLLERLDVQLRSFSLCYRLVIPVFEGSHHGREKESVGYGRK